MMNTVRIFSVTFVLTVFILSCSTSQPEDGIILLPKWKPGDFKTVTVVVSETWKENDENEASTRIDTIDVYFIKILDKTKKGYVVELKKKMPEEIHSEFELLNEYFNNLKYIVETDTSGVFVDLQNWKLLLNMNNDIIKELHSIAREEEINEFELKIVMEKINMAMNKSELIQQCSNWFDMLLGIFGEAVFIDDTIREPVRIPNRMFEEGIPVINTTIARIDDDERICITYSTEYEYDEIRELYKKHYPDQEYREKKTISRSEYFFNPKTGWPEKIVIYAGIEDKDFTNLNKIEYVFE